MVLAAESDPVPELLCVPRLLAVALPPLGVALPLAAAPVRVAAPRSEGVEVPHAPPEAVGEVVPERVPALAVALLQLVPEGVAGADREAELLDVALPHADAVSPPRCVGAALGVAPVLAETFALEVSEGVAEEETAAVALKRPLSLALPPVPAAVAEPVAVPPSAAVGLPEGLKRCTVAVAGGEAVAAALLLLDTDGEPVAVKDPAAPVGETLALPEPFRSMLLLAARDCVALLLCVGMPVPVATLREGVRTAELLPVALALAQLEALNEVDGVGDWEARSGVAVAAADEVLLPPSETVALTELVGHPLRVQEAVREAVTLLLPVAQGLALPAPRAEGSAVLDGGAVPVSDAEMDTVTLPLREAEGEGVPLRCAVREGEGAPEREAQMVTPGEPVTLPLPVPLPLREGEPLPLGEAWPVRDALSLPEVQTVLLSEPLLRPLALAEPEVHHVLKELAETVAEALRCAVLEPDGVPAGEALLLALPHAVAQNVAEPVAWGEVEVLAEPVPLALGESAAVRVAQPPVGVGETLPLLLPEALIVPLAVALRHAVPPVAQAVAVEEAQALEVGVSVGRLVAQAVAVPQGVALALRLAVAEAQTVPEPVEVPPPPKEGVALAEEQRVEEGQPEGVCDVEGEGEREAEFAGVRERVALMEGEPE